MVCTFLISQARPMKYFLTLSLCALSFVAVAQVAHDLNYFIDIQEQYGYNVPSEECLLSISQTLEAIGCGDWSFSEFGSGFGEIETLEVPSGSGALHVSCGGQQNTRDIFIPGTFAHAFLHLEGFNNLYNIHYNPNTTTLIGGLGGTSNSSNCIEDRTL